MVVLIDWLGRSFCWLVKWKRKGGLGGGRVCVLTFLVKGESFWKGGRTWGIFEGELEWQRLLSRMNRAVITSSLLAWSPSDYAKIHDKFTLNNYPFPSTYHPHLAPSFPIKKSRKNSAPTANRRLVLIFSYTWISIWPQSSIWREKDRN